ncbi:MAG: hypothetical protein A2Y28_02555 [Chlamydiae bacterium GWC2_50_10]|nr:MAG: hypothetical protein A2Y28_02555 [Chlamydiae bacterium GWC2_50_10]OGN57982.1 MAG: hypothetical protein A3D18_05515 [Chlamydiae bacterium RIFCSPHIGHO2_02_FULL_49_29]OGN63190.1 MAG: hypothetical protein A3E26_06390 [Chlamydiae bacterium RIFCSPHIGHO2_12_FULL_49_32]OGN67618.1 MAG: hypothetical protein A3I15_02840 [Chlamydiae bacterium RIFCSPLOWO2_02_FULL_49_12]OGN70931.1 MAG: hypothetical protein A3G30_06260 [Chlamydiae bacterium RIFCSPLOWO2_12_FULL_49_12]HAZ15751.1 hypothetical protein [P
MKQTLSPQQENFFQKNGYLELEGLLNEADCKEFLQRRSKLCPNGRDLGQRDSWILSLAKRRSWTHFAKELFQTPFLRLALDHYFQSSLPFLQGLTLNQAYSFQSLLGGLLLRLTDSLPSQEKREPLSSLLETPGNGLFFSADTLLDRTRLNILSGQSFWMIGYGTRSTLYIYNAADPQAHLLKAEGYSYGDRLSAPRHPLLH